MANLASSYVKTILGFPEDGETPPVSIRFSQDRLIVVLTLLIQYITIHARHGDFSNWCWAAEKPEDCFAPLSVIERRVRSVLHVYH